MNEFIKKSEIEELVQDGTRLGQENETLKDNNEHLAVMLEETRIELEAMRGAANSLKMHYEKAEAEIERLQAEKDALVKNYAECMKDYASEIFVEIEREIIAALRSNYSAKQERVEKQIPDDFVSYMCEGKIAALRGIDDFLAELKKKYTEGKMIENNFTDEQVIKALECCAKGGACTSCPLKDDYSPCSSSMAHLALSLINKQKNDLDLLKSTITHKEEEAYNKGYADAKKSILRDIKAIMQIIILDYKEIGAFDNAEIVGYVRDHLITELEKIHTEGVKKE